MTETFGMSSPLKALNFDDAGHAAEGAWLSPAALTALIEAPS